MEIAEILKWQNNIGQQIYSNPETAFEYFKTEWNKQLNDAKENLAVLLIRNCSDIIDYKHDYSSSYYYNAQMPTFFNREKSDEQKACCGLILIYIENEFNGKPKLGKLKLGHSKGTKDIAAIIKLLYTLGYFDNTIDEVADVLSRVFDINYNTIRSYLKNPDKLEDHDLALAVQLHNHLKTKK